MKDEMARHEARSPLSAHLYHTHAKMSCFDCRPTLELVSKHVFGL